MVDRPNKVSCCDDDKERKGVYMLTTFFQRENKEKFNQIFLFPELGDLVWYFFQIMNPEWSGKFLDSYHEFSDATDDEPEREQRWNVNTNFVPFGLCVEMNHLTTDLPQVWTLGSLDIVPSVLRTIFNSFSRMGNLDGRSRFPF